MADAYPSWWYAAQKAWEKKVLLLESSCQTSFDSYYEEVRDFLLTQQDLCFFRDENYSWIKFNDVVWIKEKWAIDTLLDYCIVKWRWSSLKSFSPDSRVSRAEFSKMLAKILAMVDWFTFAEEGQSWTDTWFIDVKKKHWSSEYVRYLETRWLLDVFQKSILTQSFFFPNKSVTVPEVAEILAKVWEGQDFTRLQIIKDLDNNQFATRSEIAEILVRKFIPHLSEALYLQGNNRVYFEQLLQELKGKNEEQQYDLIVRQIRMLEWYSEDTSFGVSELYPHWIVSYLRSLISWG